MSSLLTLRRSLPARPYLELQMPGPAMSMGQFEFVGPLISLATTGTQIVLQERQRAAAEREARHAAAREAEFARQQAEEAARQQAAYAALYQQQEQPGIMSQAGSILPYLGVGIAILGAFKR